MSSKVELLNGDCLSLMQDVADNSIDLILCDLPYGTTACTWDTIIPFDLLWEHYNKILKETGTIILFGSQPFTSKIIMSNYDNFRYEYIWVKNNCSNFQLSQNQPLKYHENICVFYNDIIQTCFADIMKEEMIKHNLVQKDLQMLCPSKNGNPTGWVSNKLTGKQIPTAEQWELICGVFGIENKYDELLDKLKCHTYNQDTKKIIRQQSNKGKAGSLGHLSTNKEYYVQTETDFPKSVLYFNRESNIYHPTQKPIDLLKFLIKTHSNKGDIVLDNCMGSGSTGVASVLLDRNFIGMEIEEKYFKIAKERINRAENERKMMLW